MQPKLHLLGLCAEIRLFVYMYVCVFCSVLVEQVTCWCGAEGRRTWWMTISAQIRWLFSPLIIKEWHNLITLIELSSFFFFRINWECRYILGSIQASLTNFRLMYLWLYHHMLIDRLIELFSHGVNHESQNFWMKIRRNGAVIGATPRINLESIILSGRSWSQKTTCCLIPLNEMFAIGKLTRHRVRLVAA